MIGKLQCVTAKVGIMIQTACMQWRVIDNSLLCTHHYSRQVSRTVDQIRIYDKSYANAHRHVRRIYCKNMNCIIWSYNYGEHKLRTDAAFIITFAAIKYENTNSSRRYKCQRILRDNYDTTAVSDSKSTNKIAQGFLVYINYSHISK